MKKILIKKLPCWLVIEEYFVGAYDTYEDACGIHCVLNEGGTPNTIIMIDLEEDKKEHSGD